MRKATSFFLLLLLFVLLGMNWSYQNWKTSVLKEKGTSFQTSFGSIEAVIRGEGNPVLILHGTPGGYDQGLILGSSLESQGFKVIAPSRPGYRETSITLGKTAEEEADALIALLDKLAIEKVSIIGFSGGAPVAFQMALRHPSRVDRVVLASLGSQVEEASNFKVATSAWVKFMRANQTEDIVSWFFSLWAHYFPKSAIEWVAKYDSSSTENARQARVEYILKHQKPLFLQFIDTWIPLSLRKEGLKNDIDHFLNPWPFYALEKMKAKTLIIQSKDDALGSFEEATKVANGIPDATLLPLSESGYFVFFGSQADKLEKSIIEFLK